MKTNQEVKQSYNASIIEALERANLELTKRKAELELLLVDKSRDYDLLNNKLQVAHYLRKNNLKEIEFWFKKAEVNNNKIVMFLNIIENKIQKFWWKNRFF